MDNTFKEFLQEKGYKFTKQRQVVMEVFAEREGEHMTTEEVFHYAGKKCPKSALPPSTAP